MTFDEDRCQIRSGAAPQASAACRGHATIAEATRTYAGRPRLAIALVVPTPHS